MDENHQDKIESKLTVTEEKLGLPLLSSKDQKKVERLQNKPRNAIIKETGFSGKTLWDWLQLLLIPFLLTVGGFWFSVHQNQTSPQQTNLPMTLDQQQDVVLKTCIDDLKDLLLNKGLISSRPEDSVRIVAREEVLSTLRQLDGRRKGLLLQTLSDARLITRIGDDVIIDLTHADLRSAELSGAELPWVDLSEANLNGAILSGTDLSGANLSGANLSNADLNGANLNEDDLNGASLSGANLSGANLSEASLRGADLIRAVVTKEQLDKTYSLIGATMPNGSVHP